ncbi:hypothetical protein E4T49_00842 [Aureobasidium sp. EXF-10728]|nr:hypothetical protein E4T49_00842 [Aureobasidium sp. EXF-10728]
MASMASGPTHPFTCNTCQVAFRSSDLQRTHMQSDWHRYNLKRRVASLPPLTSEVFAEKVLANKASAAATAARASFEKVCSACQKTYFSENAYANHLGSQKHRQQIARMHMRDVDDASSVMSSTFSLGEPLETASNVETASVASVATDRPEERDADLSHITDGVQQTDIADDDNSSRAPTDADDMVEVLLNQCLFCNTICEDLDENIKHMSKQHGMFIPEREFLVDLEGLLSYLHEKIHDDHQCLYCGQLKHTASGIQTHMRDRGHCMIPYSTEDDMLEIGEFYDFRSTYSDDEDDESTDGADDQQEGGVKLGAARATKVTIETEDGDGDAEMADEDDEGWESDGSLSSVPTDEITSVPIDDHSHRYKTLDRHRHHSHKDPRPHRNTDGYHSHAHSTPHAVYHDEYELHLPTGRTAGHRSLAKYYRQNLRNYPTAEERAEQRAIEGRHDSDDEEEARRSRHDRGRQIVTRAEGGLGMVGVSEVKKKEVRAAEKREKKREQRAQANYQWGNDKRGNNQKHFRLCSIHQVSLTTTSAHYYLWMKSSLVLGALAAVSSASSSMSTSSDTTFWTVVRSSSSANTTLPGPVTTLTLTINSTMSGTHTIYNNGEASSTTTYGFHCIFEDIADCFVYPSLIVNCLFYSSLIVYLIYSSNVHQPFYSPFLHDHLIYPPHIGQLSNHYHDCDREAL